MLQRCVTVTDEAIQGTRRKGSVAGVDTRRVATRTAIAECLGIPVRLPCVDERAVASGQPRLPFDGEHFELAEFVARPKESLAALVAESVLCFVGHGAQI